VDHSRILFFTRGRGRGHALPDLVIARRVRQLRPGVELRFASYATGAETLAEHGEAVIDLGLPEDAPFVDLLVAATATMAAQKPDVVVAHEELAVLPAARGLGHAPVLIIDFFPQHELPRHSLRHAERILFIEQRGIFGEPPEARGKVQYLGPVLPPLSVARGERGSCREALGLAATATVVAVIPGRWATEEKAPIFDLVLPAWRGLSGDRTLIWIAGRDHDELSRRAARDHDVKVWPHCSPIETLMVASDVVITKANRGTTIDLSRLAIPSIALSHGLNPVDEKIIARLHTNLLLHARGIDPPFLTAILEQAIAASHAGAELAPSPLYATCASGAVAHHILRLAGEVRPPDGAPAPG
jgi:hypothetical protein